MILLSFLLLVIIMVSFLDIIECPLSLRISILIILGVVLALVAGLRYGDRDYFSYLDIYESTTRLFTDFDATEIHGEPGYLLLNRVCKTLSLGLTGVFLIMSFSSVALCLNFFRKNTPYFLLALLIYFSHVFMLRDMMQVRAGLAASISLYALQYIGKRKFLPFILIILLAASMHTGVLILILAYLSYPLYLKYPGSVKYLVVLGFLIGLLLNAALIEYLVTNFFNLPGVSVYLADPEYFASLGLLNLVLIKNVILLGFIIYFRPHIKDHVPHYDVYLLCLALGIFWLSAFNNFAILAARLATYFANVEHILLPALFLTRINRFLLWGIVVAYCLVMFVSKFSIFDELTYLFLR
ncbi:MAG TPA: EpsG family protein [Pedobacter sp.]|nr:EpsG family protein [Pedobacter sp.]